MAKCVVVTGDRTWSTKKQRAVIRKYVDDIPDDVLIVEGGCQGVDQLTAEICRTDLQRSCLSIPAPFKKMGKPAGPYRNQQMINLQPILVLAFHNKIKKSKGTKDCVKRALKREIPVHQINSRGQHRLLQKNHFGGRSSRSKK